MLYAEKYLAPEIIRFWNIMCSFKNLSSKHFKWSWLSTGPAAMLCWSRTPWLRRTTQHLPHLVDAGHFHPTIREMPWVISGIYSTMGYTRGVVSSTIIFHLYLFVQINKIAFCWYSTKPNSQSQMWGFHLQNHCFVVRYDELIVFRHWKFTLSPPESLASESTSMASRHCEDFLKKDPLLTNNNQSSNWIENMYYLFMASDSCTYNEYNIVGNAKGHNWTRKRSKVC